MGGTMNATKHITTKLPWIADRMNYSLTSPRNAMGVATKVLAARAQQMRETTDAAKDINLRGTLRRSISATIKARAFASRRWLSQIRAVRGGK